MSYPFGDKNCPHWSRGTHGERIAVCEVIVEPGWPRVLLIEKGSGGRRRTHEVVFCTTPCVWSVVRKSLRQRREITNRSVC